MESQKFYYGARPSVGYPGYWYGYVYYRETGEEITSFEGPNRPTEHLALDDAIEYCNNSPTEEVRDAVHE